MCHLAPFVKSFSDSTICHQERDVPGSHVVIMWGDLGKVFAIPQWCRMVPRHRLDNTYTSFKVSEKPKSGTMLASACLYFPLS